MAKLDLRNPDFIRDLLYANGIIDRVNYDMYNQIYRFGIMSPEEAMKDCKEYLFFTKPDLHIMNGKTGKLNKELENIPFFQELLAKYPNVIEQLQLSADKENNPLSYMLTNNVVSNLDMPGLDSNSIDTPVNMHGTGYEYRGSSEASDDNHSFSLEFEDNKYLEQYMYFKAYEEYETLKRHGRVTPPDIQKYVVDKVLHDAIGIYKFFCDEDGETILYYAYFCGVTWNSLPRDAFSNPNFDDGISYNINAKAAFVEDMNPLILRDFNALTEDYRKRKTTKDVPLYNIEYGQGDFKGVKAAYIKTDIDRNTLKPKYKLKWRS